MTSLTLAVNPKIPAVVEKNADEICERIAGGETLSAICKELEVYPHYFHAACRADMALRDAYEEARRQWAHILFDKVMSIAESLDEGDVTDTQRLKAKGMAADLYKWMAGKLNPPAYSEKPSEHKGVAVQINTNLDLELEEDPSQDKYVISLSDDDETS